MDGERNFANMARNMTGDGGQALQHFMSNAPWSGPEVFRQLQAEIAATPALAQGSTLILDESADERLARITREPRASITAGWARWMCVGWTPA